MLAASGGAARRADGWHARWLEGRRADVLALLAGALSAAALPPLCIVPVLLVAVPALLALIDTSRTPWVAARRGWLFGFGHHLFGLYWITEAILFEAARLWWAVPLAVPALAAVLAVFIAVPCALARCAAPGWSRVAVLAGAWVAADLARQFVATGFPWNLWGSVWELPGLAGDVLIQPAAWIGIHGLTWLTIMLAATPALGRRAMLGGAAVLAAWIGLGAWRISRPLPPAPGVEAVLVQGNVAEGAKWNRALTVAIFRRYLQLTREGLATAGAGPKVVVWPETASPFLLTEDTRARDAIAEAAASGKGDPATVLAGTVRFGADERPRNALAAVEPDGRIAALYDKWHLVPFGEFQPDWFPLPFQVVPGGGFAPGSGPTTLHLPGLPPVAPIICYEAIYSGELVSRTDRPAWLVNVTNDAWFGNSSGPRQHLAAARMRAVEEGLPLLRAANTGITAAFDARGHELARIATDMPGFLTVALPAALPATVYSRWGLALPASLAFLSLVIGAGMRYFTRR